MVLSWKGDLIHCSQHQSRKMRCYIDEENKTEGYVDADAEGWAAIWKDAVKNRIQGTIVHSNAQPPTVPIKERITLIE